MKKKVNFCEFKKRNHGTGSMNRTNRRIETNAETLVGIDAFRQLNAVERQALAARCTCFHYQPGQQIVSYHDGGRDVFFMVSGQAQATIFSLSGKQVTLQDLGPGAMFGELSAIDGRPRSAHIVALTDALICSMSPDDFMDAVHRYPAVADITLRRLTGMVRLLSERVFEISALPVKNRIHAELLRLAVQNPAGCGDAGAVIAPAPTHSDIASHIGTHREGVTRELNRLKQQGLLARQGNSLVIHDVSRLRTMVSEVMGAA